jgi:hypothetical protein
MMVAAAWEGRALDIVACDCHAASVLPCGEESDVLPCLAAVLLTITLEQCMPTRSIPQRVRW